MKPHHIPFLLVIVLLVACASTKVESSPLPNDVTAITNSPEPSASVTSTHTNSFSDCPLPVLEGTNGKLRLAYVTEGNLWLLDEGKEPVQMIDNGDVEQIMLSPDGSRIVLTRRKEAETVEVWSVDSLGWRNLSGEQGITGGVEFISFSDDQNFVVFHRLANPDQELWVADVNKANVYPLVRIEDLPPREEGTLAFLVGWIPGTHQLTYVPVSFTGGGDPVPPPEPVLWVNADNGEQGVLFPVGQGGYITYSPDGKTMVISDHSHVRLMRVNNLSEAQTIAGYTPICGIPDCYIPEPSWRADSSSFLLTLPSEGMNPDDFLNGLEEPFTIWDISANGSSIQRLGEIFRVNGPLSFSLDLKRVAYYRQESIRNLHIANVNGSQDIPYDSSVEFFGWAPDSQHFAYQAFQDMPFMYGDICGQATQLTDVVGAQFLGWLDVTRIFLLVGTDFYLSPAGGISTPLLQIGEVVVYDYVLMPK